MGLRSRASAAGRWGGLGALVVIPFLWTASGWYEIWAGVGNSRMGATCHLIDGMLGATLRIGPRSIAGGWGVGITPVREYRQSPCQWRVLPCSYNVADFSGLPGG